MYDDYAINSTLFHWQSQSTTSVDSPTGQRYIHHRRNNPKILMTTNAKGQCEIAALAGADKIEIRYSGYQTLTKSFLPEKVRSWSLLSFEDIMGSVLICSYCCDFIFSWAVFSSIGQSAL
jgi:hypothetical protein